MEVRGVSPSIVHLISPPAVSDGFPYAVSGSDGSLIDLNDESSILTEIRFLRTAL